MSTRSRCSSPPTDDWTQLRLLFTEPAQEAEELIRPVVLFKRSAALRAKQSGGSARTIARKAQRFATGGTARRFDVAPSKPPRSGTFPEEIRQALLTVKATHPPFRLNELATIGLVRFDRRPDAKTIRRIVAEGSLPTVVGHRFPPYVTIADPMDRR